MDGFVIAFPKEHPVVKAAKKEKLTEIFQNLLWTITRWCRFRLIF